MTHKITDNTARRAAISLGGLAALVVITVLGVQMINQDRIDTARAELREQRVSDVLPAQGFDVSQSGDVIVDDNAYFTEDAPLPILRYWKDGAPAAAVMQVVAPDGYNGDIVLLMGVNASGIISGVRVLSHRETPGLGDDIDRRRSDWITRFDGLSLDVPDDAAWAVAPRGGDFDAFTGATITPQAVVLAIHRALIWFDTHSAALFAAPREAS